MEEGPDHDQILKGLPRFYAQPPKATVTANSFPLQHAILVHDMDAFVDDELSYDDCQCAPIVRVTGHIPL